MALLFLDSWDHYSTAQGSRKWTSFNGSIVPGRTGNGMSISPLNNFKTLNDMYDTLTMGIAFKTPNFGNSIVNMTSSTAGVTAGFAFMSDGKMFCSVNGGTVFPSFPSSAPSAFVINKSQWYYAEFSATISITNNVVANTRTLTIDYEGRINEATILSGSLTNTYSGTTTSAGAKWTEFGISGPGGGLNATGDDLYVTDGEFLGDIKVGVLYPNAAGDSSDWTPTPAAANYANVKEHPADNDATIVTAATVGLKDLYNLDDIPPTFAGTIKGVQALWLTKKSDAGSAFVKGVWKSGATEIVQSQGYNYISPNGYPPSAFDYIYTHEAERASLFTSADWTVSEINGLQLGIKRTV